MPSKIFQLYDAQGWEDIQHNCQHKQTEL